MIGNGNDADSRALASTLPLADAMFHLIPLCEYVSLLSLYQLKDDGAVLTIRWMRETRA